ncbi:hypothetical protein Tco_0965042 [Tanacetum coccineum]
MPIVEAWTCTQDWVRKSKTRINWDDVEDLIKDYEIVKDMKERLEKLIETDKEKQTRGDGRQDFQSDGVMDLATASRHDVERYVRGYEAYEPFLAMSNQEAGGSRSALKKKRTYIPCGREETEQRLLDDYFGDDETLPKYTKEYFRRMYRMSYTLLKKIVNDITNYNAQPLPEYFRYFKQREDRTGRASIGPIMNCTSAICQLAYVTSPYAFDE